MFNICKMQPRSRNISENNPSVSFADSSLYTREPDFVTSFFDKLKTTKLLGFAQELSGLFI